VIESVPRIEIFDDEVVPENKTEFVT